MQLQDIVRSDRDGIKILMNDIQCISITCDLLFVSVSGCRFIPNQLFDSGVGGLTVYKEVKKMLPNEKIIYIGDTKNFPYGSKTKESIIELSKNCIDFLISKNVKEVIIACGTATSQALDEMRKIYDIRFFLGNYIIISIISKKSASLKTLN